MAIAVVYRPPAMTSKQYKESWLEGPPVSPPDGLIFHAGVGDGADFTTLTIWESKDAYDAFATIFERIMSEKGFQFGAPQILPVHHFLVPR